MKPFRRVSYPSLSSSSTPSVPLTLTFDADKSLFCKLDPPARTTACHAPGGKGYCLTEQSISGSSGCYTWTFTVSKETKGNEGTCVGVSVKDPQDYSHRTTKEMWLYRAYSGNLYHSGELPTQLRPYSSQKLI